MGLSPYDERLALRSVEVMAAAMDLSWPFQEAQIPISPQHRALLSLSSHRIRLPPTPAILSTRLLYASYIPTSKRYYRLRYWEISKSRSLGGAVAECVGVLFDHLLSRSPVHDLSAGIRACTTNPMAPHAPQTTCTWPCAAVAAWLAITQCEVLLPMRSDVL